MDYFETSQRVKAEIRTDSGLVSLIASHVKGDFDLKRIGEGNNNTIYRVGCTASGLWIALRENKAWGAELEHYAEAALIYNSYCLAAEEARDPPRFCVGGVCGKMPFLLVEDVTEGGEYYAQEIVGGLREKILLFRGDETRIRAVDFGNDSPYQDADEKTKHELIFGTFDIGTLKYFAPDARMEL